MNAPTKNHTSLDLKLVLKLLGIIAFWETLLMAILPKFGLPLLAEGVLDAGSLTLLSGLSIWFLIILPEKKKTEKDHSASIHLMGQEIHAIDQIGIVSACDLNGKIIYVNDNFCKTSGYSRKELMMKDHCLLNSGLHPKEFF